MYCFFIFLIIILLFLYIYFNFKISYEFWKSCDVYYLEPTFPFGSISGIFLGKFGIGDSIKSLYSQTKWKFAGIYFIKSPALLIKDPELIKCILVKDFNSFMDRGIYINEKKEPTSGHLFKLSGERWRGMRNKLTPAFTAGKLKLMFDALTNVATKLDESLTTSIATTNIIDVDDLTTRYSADIIASTIYGIEINSFVDRYNEFILMAKDLFISTSHFRIFKAVLQIFFPKILNIFSITSVKESQNKFIHKMVQDVITHREYNRIVRKDMMQLLIQLKNYGDVGKHKICKDEKTYNKECNKRITLNEISAQAYTFFFAGYETTSSTMSFFLYECALNHQLQNRIHKEIDITLDKYSGRITYESISEMEYLNRAILETLRKYPILPYLNRITTNDYIIPGTNIKIKKGTRIIISISGLHHDPAYYPNPNDFNPDRFIQENLIKRHPFTYLPFGEGPRNCIGKRMGKMIVAVGIVTILKNYFVDVEDETEVPLQFNKLAYFIQTNNPVKLKFLKRDI